jgi:hypothetical protein
MYFSLFGQHLLITEFTGKQTAWTRLSLESQQRIGIYIDRCVDIHENHVYSTKYDI